jgi:hypothetical protein
MTAHQLARHLVGMPPSECGAYEIRVGGHLAPRWAALFDGMSLTAQDDGTTVIRGAVADQAALYGLLRTLSDIGVPLLAVTPTTPGEPGTTPTTRRH